MAHDPCTLPQIIKNQCDFHKNPGNADVCLAAMPDIRIESFSTRGAKEYSSKQDEAAGILREEPDCICRVQGFENSRIMQDL